MLKKNLYATSYILTALSIVGCITYYVFLLQKGLVSVSQHSKLIQVATNQSVLVQQIEKNATGMGHSSSERTFYSFKNELSNALLIWEKGHVSLDAELGISQPSQTQPNDYLALREALQFSYVELNSNVANLLDVSYPEEADVNALPMRRSIDLMVNAIKDYQVASQNMANFFVDETHRKTNLSLSEYVCFGVLLGIFLIQGFSIFRPLVKLASGNSLSTSKAFEKKCNNAEHSLTVNLQEQKLSNQKLQQSQIELEDKNLKLQESQEKLLASSQLQINSNEKLIHAQDELKATYKELQNSEVEIRLIAEKQLQDNKQLVLAEKKLQATLQKEQNSKKELSQAIESLKNAQSQLVQSEKMASLGQLTAGIAHEINNPINFISSGLFSLKISIGLLKEIVDEYSRMEEGDDPEKVIESVRALKEEHEYDEIVDELDDLVKDVHYGLSRTIEIVKGLRIFSRLDEGEVKDANVNESIDATLILLKNRTKGKVKITKHYDESMKDIESFPSQLNQVFMNILINAVQAMPEDKKDAEITIHTEESDNEVLIRIKDNGIGMSDEIKNKIWEPFFTTKDVGVGTGLGMSITYGIVEKHGGKIALESDVGKGTEFAITLPQKMREDIPLTAK